MPPTRRKYVVRRNNKNFVAIPFQVEITTAALGDGLVNFASLVGNFGEDIFIISIDCLWSTEGMTAGEGPLAVGFSHGDLSATEVVEALDASLTDPDDIIALERSRRPVRKAGVFPILSIAETLKQGEAVRTRLKFSVGDGHPINAWVHNQSGGQLAAGSVIETWGTIFGRWQR